MSPLSANMKRFFPMAVAILMGSLAIVLAHRWVTQQRQALEQERSKLMEQYKAPIEVVVAAQDLPDGAILEPTHVRMASVPERFVQPYAVRAPHEVMGKVVLAPIAEGEQIMTTKVRRPEEVPTGTTLSGVMPKGKRAVTIAVDTLTGVGGFVRPGDLIDVLWTLKLPPEKGQGEGQAVTLTLFQDVPVLAIGGEMTGRPTGPGGSAAKRRGAEGQQGTEAAQYLVTMGLTPQETSFLLFAREQGRIQLSLRPRLEDGQVAVAPANINNVMTSVLGTPAAPPPEAKEVKTGPRQVEIYKSLKREVVALGQE